MTRSLTLACVAALALGASAAHAQDQAPPEPDPTVIVLPSDDYPPVTTTTTTTATPTPAPTPDVPDVADGARGADEGYIKKTNLHAITAATRTSGPTVPGLHAVKRDDGTAAAPRTAPLAVKEMIWTANRLIGLRYRYGGGHVSFADSSYDCSGSVSYALHAAGLLNAPMVSGDLATWGHAGRGRWVTIFANNGHVYMSIAGLRLDTSAVNDPGGLDGPRWRPEWRPSARFHIRHPAGL